MSTTSTKKQTVKLNGFEDDKSVLSFDATLSNSSGNIGYTKIGDATAVDTDITVQNMKATVVKSGKNYSDNVNNAFVQASVGNSKANKHITIIKSEDNAKYLLHSMSSIVQSIASKSSLTISYKGYDLNVESYEFTGKTLDCLNDIANLVYGTVVYKPTTDEYMICAGDFTSSQSIGGVTVDSDLLISYSIYTEIDTRYKTFGLMLINAAKEIAKLRQQILALEAAVATTTPKTKILGDRVQLRFGWFGGHKQIDHDIEVDSTSWDTWYEDELGNKYVNDTKPVNNTDDKVFTPRQNNYFKIETLTETIVRPGYQSDTYTVTRGKVRGLRTLSQATLYIRLKNIDSDSGVKGRGKLTNLDTLGMPSLTEYINNKNKANNSSDPKAPPYDDGYYTLYDVVTRKVVMKNNDLDTYEELYVPFLAVKMPPSIYNAVNAALVYKLARQPTESEINNALLVQQYSIDMELMLENEVTGGMKYVGYIDKYGRVITVNNQVVLVSGITDPNTYYAPLEGMDVNFNSAFNTTTVTSGLDIFSNYFNSATIATDLTNAYKDLRTLATDENATKLCTSEGASYPKFLYEILKVAVNGSTKGGIVGVILGAKENDENLSLSTYTSADRQKLVLQRKLNALESKINLMIKCINKKSQAVSLSDIKDKLKIIIEYEAVLYEVKNENLQTLLNKKTIVNTNIDYFLDTLATLSIANVTKIDIKTVLHDNVPPSGSSLSVLGGKYTITSASASGLELSITGEAV